MFTVFWHSSLHKKHLLDRGFVKGVFFAAVGMEEEDGGAAVNQIENADQPAHGFDWRLEFCVIERMAHPAGFEPATP